MEHFLCVPPRGADCERSLPRRQTLSGPKPSQRCWQIAHPRYWTKRKKDKGKKNFSVGLKLILRPHTDESGSAGKGKKQTKKRISAVQSSGMVRRHVGNPLHHLASGQQKRNDWWRLCSIQTASLANRRKQLLCHAEHDESHVSIVAVLNKHALCRSRAQPTVCANKRTRLALA